MEGKPAGRFAIAIAVNFILVFLAAMLLHPYPAQMDEAFFAKVDGRYEGCTVLSSLSEQEMTYYLVRTDTGETDLIPAKVNSFLSSRWRLCKRAIVTLSDPEAEQTVTPMIGMQRNEVRIANGQIQSVRAGLLIQSQADSIFYFAIAFALAGAELFLFDKITGKKV